MQAIFNGDIETFDALVQDGVDINKVVGKDRWNFLHRALVSLSLQPVPLMIEHLIKCGVDVNAKDSYGNTPLHYAARLKNPELIGMLLDAGADIDTANKKGCTPLREMLLAKPCNLDTIELLLYRGANMNHPGAKGITIRDYVNIIAQGDDSNLLDLFDKYQRK
jgi:ankyrin repeat protein